MTRVLLTSYGWEDAGGGTRVPRNVARELRRRGHDVTVFHAAVDDLAGAPEYAVRRWRDGDGIELVGVHNRPHVMLDLDQPLREIDDPAISATFGATLDRVRPEVVHFHNLHNLGAALIDETRARGIPAFYTTHNHWLVCPRAYLVTAAGELCDGVADEGRSCAACANAPARAREFAVRRSEVRDRFTLGVERCLAVSASVARTMESVGYRPDQIVVLQQAMPEPEELWRLVGRDRAPGPIGEGLVVGFIGSAHALKGPKVLVDAAQLLPPGVHVRIHGDVRPDVERWLRSADTGARVELAGAFATAELPTILASIDVAVVPSVVQDCAPLVIAECLAARVPVVGARIGGIPELVRDGVDGLLFAPGDADALTAVLTRLADEDGLLEELQGAIVAPTPFATFVDELERTYAGSTTVAVSASSQRRRTGEVPGGRGRNLLAAPAWGRGDLLDALLQSWTEAFSPTDDVALVLLIDTTGDSDVTAAGEQIEAIIGGAGVADVVLLQATAGEALALAESCDGVVALHRGAPGLLRAAIASGVPVVAPDHAALRAWAA